MRLLASWAMTIVLLIIPAHAESLGYLRVRVLDQNLEHHYKAQLTANATPIGEPFSHDNDGRPLSVPYAWAPIALQHLSANSNATPIFAKYSFGDYCQFGFSVDFSLDGQNTLATWGPFRAPFSNLVGTIPLGQKCPAHMPPPCSSDAQLQKKLAWHYTKSLVKGLLNWKTDYSQELNSRRTKADADIVHVAQSLNAAATPKFDQNRQVLQDMIDQWKKEFDTIQEHAQRSSQEANGNASIDAQELVDRAVNNGDMTTHQEERARSLPGTPLGNLYDSLPELVHEQRELYEAEPTPEGARQLEQLRQNVEFFRHGILKGEAFVHVAGRMIETGAQVAAPESAVTGMLGATFSVCEITTGHEYCVGRALSEDERAAKGCSLVMKHILPWKALKKMLADGSASGLVVDAIESKIQSGVCSG